MLLKKNNTLLPSANFFVETKGKEKIDDDIDGTGIKLFDSFGDDKYPEKFIITGGGFGHGVGMSQFGASNLAKMGKKYSEILKHYYTGINISTVPKQVQYNEHNMSYKSEFYFDDDNFKEAYLIINNDRNVGSFPFKINEFEFSDTSIAAKNKLVKINITQYLKSGLNMIDFLPLNREYKGREVIYRVEFL